MNDLPTAKSVHSPNDRAKLKRVIAARGLCGLANDTKWDEFIAVMRLRKGWTPHNRCKCFDGPASSWDAEWIYHLPFPLLSLEWLDIIYLEEKSIHRLPRRISFADHSPWQEELLRKIGLGYQKGGRMIRIFGYSPKSLDLFDL